MQTFKKTLLCTQADHDNFIRESLSQDFLNKRKCT
jgi:hypothetical protein